jgi:hypothetical protein
MAATVDGTVDMEADMEVGEYMAAVVGMAAAEMLL